MTAISVSFSPKVATDWDPQKPLTTTKLNQLYDNTEFVKQWLGQSYIGGAVQNHSHDGLDSALIPVGRNMIRNGSFESGSTNFDLVTGIPSGATAQIITSALTGGNSLQMTSVNSAIGGGYIESVEFMPCIGIVDVSLGGFRGSVAGISSKLQIAWYSAKNSASLISTSDVFSCASCSINTTNAQGSALVPVDAGGTPTAKYFRVRVYTNLPGVGVAGTVIYDELSAATRWTDYCLVPGTTVLQTATVAGPVAASPIKALEFKFAGAGTVSVNSILTSGSSTTNGIQVYKNGVAYGALRTGGSGFATNITEDLAFAPNDLIQLYAWSGGGTVTMTIKGTVGATPVTFTRIL